MKGSSQKKEHQRQEKALKTFGVLVTSAVLVLSFVATIQLATNNVAYAQSNSETVTGSCEFDENGVLVAEFTLSNLDDPYANPDDPSSLYYYYTQLLDSSNTVIAFGGQMYIEGGTDTISFASPLIQPGEQYTYNLYQDFNHDYPSGYVYAEADPEELVATDTVTCPSPPPLPEPPLTEQFKNQGQCIAHANHNPNSGITKEECKEAFKA